MTEKDKENLLESLKDPDYSSQIISAVIGATLFPNQSAGNSSVWNSSSFLLNGSLGGNDTASSSGGFDHSNDNHWLFILFFFPMLTIFGNILVVLAVYKERSLQTVTNYYIVSLAIADILVATIVMPISVYVEVRKGTWDFGNVPCDLWIMCDALFCTASILNLVAISIDRFVAVTQPIQYLKHKNSKRTFFTIAGSWLLSVAIALPTGCGMNNVGKIRSRDEFSTTCMFFNGDFLIYSSLGSFYIPCIVMTILYYKIFTVIWDRAKKAAATKKGKTYENDKVITKYNSNNHKSKSKKMLVVSQKDPNKPNDITVSLHTGNSKRLRAADISPDCLACQTEGIYTGEVPPLHTCRSRSVSSAVSKQDESTFSANNSVNIPLNESMTFQGPSTSESGCQDGDGVVTCETKLNNAKSHKKKKNPFHIRIKPKTKKKKGDRSAARRERKATKTLAIVLGVFLLCWLPFFTLNLLWAACLKNIDNAEIFGGPLCSYDREIGSFIVWLGYINSFLNPVIYTIFNNEFRKAFKKLLNIK